ncbi:MAG TPA: tetratricopeptide repeat protein [Steroidobacteraceae bacterium]
MSHLLRAMGLWIWGLIAIAICFSLVSLSYRTLSNRPHYAVDANTRGAPPASRSQGAGAFSGVVPTPTGGSGAAVHSSKPVISKIIGKEMSAAQKALQAGQWSEALTYLEAARSKSPLTTNDVKTIEEFTGITNIRLHNLKVAQTAYEAALATGAYKTEELARIFRLLFQLAAINKQDAKAIEYGERAAGAGSATENDLMIMSQIYYQQKDCQNSGIWGDKAIAAFKEAGQAPKEVLYQLKLQCASDANDRSGMKAALYELVRLTNKTSYWNNLIRLERQDERVDHNTLMLYRVMFDTHSMNADTDYIEMAQLLGDAGLPGEAEIVLEKARKSGVLKDEHKERTARLLNALQTRAEADQEGLPALEGGANNNPAGQLDLKLGELYFGAGDYQDAVTAINRALGKGQIKELDEAYVNLGRAQVALKNIPEAKKAFEKLKGVPNISPGVLKLWTLYADVTPEPASQPL